MKIYFNNCSDHDFLYAGVYYRSKTQTEIDSKLRDELMRNRRVKQNISKGLFFTKQFEDKVYIDKPILLNPDKKVKEIINKIDKTLK